MKTARGLALLLAALAGLVVTASYADGVVIVQGSRLLHERYFNGFNADSHHIWFSMTKSLVSTAFGLLVEQPGSWPVRWPGGTALFSSDTASELHWLFYYR